MTSDPGDVGPRCALDVRGAQIRPIDLFTHARSVDPVPSPAEQTATQLANIERHTGITVDGWSRAIAEAGAAKHGEIVAWLKQQGLTHGNANALAHAVRARQSGDAATPDALLDAQYARGKAGLRPVHDEILRYSRTLGDDVDVVVQKTAVSLRRTRQFAMIEARSAKVVRLGFNRRGAHASGRVQATSGMCTHYVDLGSPEEIDDEVTSWLAEAYRAASS
ncbi:MAG TPA: DUF5655 domain-containing protein [Ilumatobacteraceae bacterium]|nr:DUF5655 domain-containing protein [Ilumatobacteraceae bacterium]